MAHVVREPCDEGVILSRKCVSPCSKVKGRWILAATILASSMAFIDGTVVNVALPFLQKNLSTTVIGVQWVVEAYSLFLSALLLVGGSLGDRYGRKLIFVIGVILACFWLVDEIYDVVQISYRRAQVPDALQGRVNSAYRVIIYSLIALGNMLTGYLLQSVGTLWTIALFAVCLVLIALWATLNAPMWKTVSPGGKGV